MSIKYTKDHEWLRLEGEIAAVGVTDFAQRQLGDVVYLDLPEVGRRVTAGESFGSIESVKAVSDLYSPISGTILARNEHLAGAPETVNADPYGEGWLLEVALSNPDELASLLDASGYDQLTA